MFCRSCDSQLPNGVTACSQCGLPPFMGSHFCYNCGQTTSPEAFACAACSAALGQAGQLGRPVGMQPQFVRERAATTIGPGGVVQNSSRVPAGVCALFLGCFGVHKFVLGYTQEGIIMLVVTLLGSLVSFGLAAIVMSIVGLIEGLVYLSKSDSDFYNAYVVRKRAWF